MAEPEDRQRLERLEAQIDALKRANAPKPTVETSGVGGAELAWRMVIELVAGIGIGFGIGYGLDVLFGTIPILLVIFTLLGFAAGVQTMMRTARAAQAREDGTGQDMPEQEDGERGDGN